GEYGFTAAEFENVFGGMTAGGVISLVDGKVHRRGLEPMANKAVNLSGGSRCSPPGGYRRRLPDRGGDRGVDGPKPRLLTATQKTAAVKSFKDWTNYLLVTTVAALGWVSSQQNAALSG